MKSSFLAVCAPGLETLLAAELMEHGLLRTRLILGPPAEAGGVAFDGDEAALGRANLRLRLTERVLVRHGPFPAPDFESLVKATAAVPWERYLAPGRPVAVRVETSASRLYHERAIAERVAEGVSTRLKAPSPLVAWAEDAPAQLVYVKLDKDVCLLGVDASGAPLHRRGWRYATGKAPLRETLAAALLRASGWDKTSPLLDPFCGSGTIAIEAALTARGVPPGGKRRFAFMEWPSFDGKAWAKEAASPALLGAFPLIQASDRDAGVIESARANAQRAGVGDAIEFSVRAVSAIEPPPGAGWVVTNPPYGVRVSEGKDLRDLYASLGKVLKAKAGGWNVSLLTSEAALARAAGLNLEPGVATLNGGLRVQVHSRRSL